MYTRKSNAEKNISHTLIATTTTETRDPLNVSFQDAMEVIPLRGTEKYIITTTMVSRSRTQKSKGQIQDQSANTDPTAKNVFNQKPSTVQIFIIYHASLFKNNFSSYTFQHPKKLLAQGNLFYQLLLLHNPQMVRKEIFPFILSNVNDDIFSPLDPVLSKCRFCYEKFQDSHDCPVLKKQFSNQQSVF